MADIVTNTLQIGNDNLILRDADAQEKITGLKEDIFEDRIDSLVPRTLWSEMGAKSDSNAWVSNKLYCKGYVNYVTVWVDSDTDSTVTVYFYNATSATTGKLEAEYSATGHGVFNIPVDRLFARDFFVSIRGQNVAFCNYASSDGQYLVMSSGSASIDFSRATQKYYHAYEVHSVPLNEMLMELYADDVPAIQEDLQKIKYRKFVFIGDSYLEGYNPEGNNSGWGTYLVNQLGLSAADYTIKYSGGAGFSSANGAKTNTFLNLITQLDSSEDVTDVVCCGGYNDQALAHTTYEIGVGIREFCKEAKIKFPNAVVSIGFIGWNKQGNGSSAPQDWKAIHSRLLDKVIPAYQTCIQYSHYTGKGCRYLTNVEYWINDSSLNNTDGFHPTEMGNQRIAMGIGNALYGSAPNATWIRPDYTDILNSAYVTDIASGSIASFPDGADNVPVKSLKVNIEPVQDLHGYDSPWPGGGGKNLIPMTLAGIKSANTGGIWSGNDYTQNGVTFTVNTNSSGDVVGITVNGTATANTELNLISNGQSFLSNGDYIFSGGYSSSIRIFYYNGNTYYDTRQNPINITIDGTETNARCTCVITSGTTASNAVLLPMIRKSTETDPTFEPYSNICPIIGWTGAKVTRTGKNLIPYPYAQTTIEVNGITFTDNGDGTITANGTSTGSAQFVLTSAVKNKEYLGCVLSGSPSSKARIRAQVYGAPWTMFATDNGNGAVITDSGYENIRFILQIDAGVTLDNAIFRPMLRASSDIDGTYTPFVKSDTYSFTFPTAAGTVYGGTLDVTSGVLTVDRAMAMLKDQPIVQRSTETSGLYRFAFRPSTALIIGENLYVVKSNALKATHAYGTYSNRHRTDYVIGNDANDSYINFFATDLQTVEAWQSFANDNNVQVMWELANPFTVQLTPQKVTTLLGTNNILANTGDVEVEYRADTKLYIEKLTAPTEDDMIADHAISANKFFMVGNQLFRATTAIASGATITVGTNATKLSLSDALNALA